MFFSHRFLIVPCDFIGPAAQPGDCAGRISVGQAIRSCGFAMFDLCNPATAVHNINIGLNMMNIGIDKETGWVEPLAAAGKQQAARVVNHPHGGRVPDRSAVSCFKTQDLWLILF